ARVRDEVDSGVPNVLSIQLDRVDGTPPPIVKDESGSWKLLVPNVAHTCLLTIVKPGQRPVYLKNVNDFQLTLAPNQRVTLFADVSRGLDNAEIIVSPV
ncbi:MAG: hypothetical protein LBR32_10425, partial [Propionibacteriaceae bacterium]|nr:hypothetical protein [Propionibacteriaceae bacterium]